MIKFELVHDVKCFSALFVARCMTVRNLCAIYYTLYSVVHDCKLI